MDLQAIAPILQETIQKVLSEKRYPFGFARYKGVGDKVASGKLKNSIQVQVKQERGISVLQVLAEDYLQWVNSGRLPNKKGVPIESIEQWIKERGLTGRNKKGRFIKRKSFAFAIQTNIKKFGIRPANIIEYSIEDIMSDDRVIELIGDAAYEELVDVIRGL